MTIKAFLADSSPLQQFLMSLFVVMVVFFVFIIAGLAIAIPLFDINLFELQDVMSNPSEENIGFLKFLQLIQSVGVFLVPPFIMAYFFSHNTLDYLQLRTKPNENSSFFVILLLLAALPLINFIYELNNSFLESVLDDMSKIRQMEEQAEKLVQMFLETDSIFGLLFNLLMIAIVPAVGEELLFRGVFQRIFSNMTRNSHLGIIISAFLFSALHMQFFGFLPRFALGVIFGYLLVWSGSLWLPILAHFVNNAMAVVAFYFINKGSISEDIEKIGGQADTQWYALIALPFFVALLYGIYRNGKPKSKLRSEIAK